MNIDKINVGGNEYDVCDAPVRAMVSDEFSEGENYTAGKICIHENKLCKFTADKAPGPWDASKVKETTLEEIYSEINSRIGSWVRVISMYVSGNETYEVDLPENKALLMAVENTYGVGCLYFVQTAAAPENRTASVYPLAQYSDYFKIESITGQVAKVKVTPGEASGTLRVYIF